MTNNQNNQNHQELTERVDNELNWRFEILGVYNEPNQPDGAMVDDGIAHVTRNGTRFGIEMYNNLTETWSQARERQTLAEITAAVDRAIGEEQ